MLYSLILFVPLILCCLLANGMVSGEQAQHHIFYCIVKWKEGERACDNVGFVLSGAFLNKKSNIANHRYFQKASLIHQKVHLELSFGLMITGF